MKINYNLKIGEKKKRGGEARAGLELPPFAPGSYDATTTPHRQTLGGVPA